MEFLSWVIHIPLISFLSWCLYKKHRTSPLAFCFWPALLIKLLASVALLLLYTEVYEGGDIISYITESQHVSKKMFDDPWLITEFASSDNKELWRVYTHAPRALFFQKVLVPFFILCLNNSLLVGFYLSLISFYALFVLADTLIELYPKSTIPAAAAFLFWPTVVLWTSGIMKESVMMVCVAWLIVVFVKPGKTSFMAWLSALPVAYILFQLKFYFAVALIPLLFGFVVVMHFASKVNILMKLAMLVFLAGTVVMLLTFFNSYLNPATFFSEVIRNHNASVGYYFGRDSIYGCFVMFENLTPGIWSFIFYAPQALFAGLFGPLPWKTFNMLQLADGLLNMTLLCISLLAVTRVLFKNKLKSDWLTYIVWIYIVFLAVFLTYASPNYGTLARYRVGYVPFLVYLVLSCFEWSAIEKKIRAIYSSWQYRLHKYNKNL